MICFHPDLNNLFFFSSVPPHMFFFFSKNLSNNRFTLGTMTSSIGVAYGTPEYWNKRYETEATYEWYLSCAQISSIVERFLPKSLESNVLVSVIAFYSIIFLTNFIKDCWLRKLCSF